MIEENLGRVASLAEDSHDFLDDGFKIKRKSKNDGAGDSAKLEGMDQPRSQQADSGFLLRLPELDVSKVAAV